MANSKLYIQRGNPCNKTITIKDSAGGVYDLTGKIVFFTVKDRSDEAYNDDAALITKDISVHTDEENGITTLELTALQTAIPRGIYDWDLRIYDADPLVQINSTKGVCEIVGIITERIS